MILPNKLISFQDCILAKTVYILEKISDSDFSVTGLYEQVETHFEDYKFLQHDSQNMYELVYHLHI